MSPLYAGQSFDQPNQSESSDNIANGNIWNQFHTVFYGNNCERFHFTVNIVLKLFFHSFLNTVIDYDHYVCADLC